MLTTSLSPVLSDIVIVAVTVVAGLFCFIAAREANEAEAECADLRKQLAEAHADMVVLADALERSCMADMAKLPPANIDRMMAALPAHSFPPDLVIGTARYPIVLDRSLFDSSLNDTAVASTVSDLVRSCGGRLV